MCQRKGTGKPGSVNYLPGTACTADTDTDAHTDDNSGDVQTVPVFR